MADMPGKHAANTTTDEKRTTLSLSLTHPRAPRSGEDEKRTTLSLSLTVSDKKALKLMAAQRDTTIAAIIHKWVQKTS